MSLGELSKLMYGGKPTGTEEDLDQTMTSSAEVCYTSIFCLYLVVKVSGLTFRSAGLVVV